MQILCKLRKENKILNNVKVPWIHNNSTTTILTTSLSELQMKQLSASLEERNMIHFDRIQYLVEKKLAS